MKGERDRWQTLAERTSLPHQRAESNLTQERVRREWWWAEPEQVAAFCLSADRPTQPRSLAR